MTDLTFKEVVQKTNELVEAFEKVEQRKWGVEGSMIELMKQVGELGKNVMMLENYYMAKKEDDPYYSKASKEEIGDELSDVFYVLLRIAKHYDIDFEKVHIREMDKALEYIRGK